MPDGLVSWTRRAKVKTVHFCAAAAVIVPLNYVAANDKRPLLFTDSVDINIHQILVLRVIV